MVGNGLIALESLVSRDQTLAHRISNYAWTKGSEIFYLETIPYSFFSGKWFADTVADAILTLKSNTASTTQYRILEVGAGVGMFPKHLLDSLKLKDKSHYSQTTLTVSDYADSALENLKERGIFHSHSEKITYKQLDITNADQLPQNNYNLITMTYVLDALPTKHYTVKNGQLFELKISTNLDKIVMALDTRYTSFSVLSAKDVVTMYTSNDLEKLWFFNWQLAPFLTETFHEAPVKNLPQNTLLNDFVNTLDPKKIHHFNYSQPAIEALINIAEKLPDEGLLLITEFGSLTTEGLDPKALIRNYGCMRFYPVCFPLIKFICERSGLSCLTIPESKSMIFYKGTRSQTLKPSIQDYNPVEIQRHLDHFLQEMKAFQGDNQEFKEHLAHKMTNLFPLLRDEYQFNINIGKLCLNRDMTDLAGIFFRKAKSVYDPVDIEAALYLTQLACGDRRFSEAENLIKNVFSKTNWSDDVHSRAATLYGLLGNKDSQFHHTEAYFKTFRLNFAWHHCVSYILMLSQKKDKAMIQKIVSWYKKIEPHYDEIPHHVRDAFAIFKNRC